MSIHAQTKNVKLSPTNNKKPPHQWGGSRKNLTNHCSWEIASSNGFRYRREIAPFNKPDF
jgi:hypothetical protein